MIYLKNTTEPQQLMIGITTGGYTYIPNGGGGESSEGYDEGYDDGYDDGYKKGQTDGYVDGKTDGIVEQKSKLTSLVVTENGSYEREDGYNKVTVDIPLPKIQEEINVELSAGETGVITPSEGYDVLKKVNYTVSDSPASVDFSVIGYNAPPLNMESDIAYTKTFYDNWKSNSDFKNDTKLVYAPMVDMNIVAYTSNMFKGCSRLLYVPQINTTEVTDFAWFFSDCSSLKEVALFDTSKATTMNYMFGGCARLENVPHFNTSNVTDMSDMFKGCSRLTELPPLNTSNVTNMSSMFYGCTSLNTANSIKDWDTSKVTNMERMFMNCSALTTFEVNWDTSNVTTMYYMFDNATKLTNIGPINCSSVEQNKYPIDAYSNITKLTDIGGFIGMKSSWTTNFGLSKCPNLTYQSCINILNGLHDFKGQTPGSSEGQLKVHANFLSLVGDEITIGTNKGWSIIS